jgi:uncharacterized protein YndB with AHSA1/START domain
MESNSKSGITVETSINAPIEKVWAYWTLPEHITQWNYATDEWHSPAAQNDLREGGNFSYRMEAKDGSMGFDYSGTYDIVKPKEKLSFTLGDGRKVQVLFSNNGDSTAVTETFEIEDLNSAELQRTGWQAILNNFKKYVESN